jgi:hypothetical protein
VRVLDKIGGFSSFGGRRGQLPWAACPTALACHGKPASPGPTSILKQITNTIKKITISNAHDKKINFMMILTIVV